ncbi:TetR family transcriptional regulator [Actinoplanes philippinensis]|uniref:DNA-binding transcriptional regulator, AcrR family n=1 Tax=Actinoplanes philippinensis TaxID=35752 RepID=A0A1I2I8W8_9ACTN|nr:TetR/AcrR family transcriptional regulator [Actinoplanes philippinensis]GIE78485.1 TetR family transcriptional regulator [Actinoplanes philippinensis]SFF38684.1 DNA-binding transcriptional regulator, AcrR family [Actinoplanes philippinensis]
MSEGDGRADQGRVRRRGATGAADDAALRAALIEAARRQLASAPGGDIATRAVCEEVGVTQPVLYRLFGDKNGLLDAVADDAFERYAQRKQELEVTDDPVADLHAGWTDHMAFAAENPAVYQLMFAPRAHAAATTYHRILELLEATLMRCAAAGALAVTPRQAARMILPANIGVTLSRIAQPHLFDDPGLPDRTRDAVFAAVLTGPARPSEPDPIRATARQMRSQLALTGTDALEPVEVALLDRWLERIDDAG